MNNHTGTFCHSEIVENGFSKLYVPTNEVANIKTVKVKFTYEHKNNVYNNNIFNLFKMSENSTT